MLRARRHVVSIVVLGLVLSGCSLLFGVDDGFAGGGGTEAADGGPSPASPDGTTQGDADVPDGTAVAEGGVVPAFCPGQANAIFCEDFDRGPLPGLFSSSSTTAGTVTRVSSTFVSNPSALEAALDGRTATDAQAIATLAALFQAGARLEADIKVRVTRRSSPPPNTSHYAEVITLDAFVGNAPGFQVGVALASLQGGFGLQLFEYTHATKTSRFLGSPAGEPEAAWLPLRLVADLAANRAELRRADASGDVLLASGALVPPGALGTPSRWQLNVGLYAYGLQTGWTVQIDDVVVRAR